MKRTYSLLAAGLFFIATAVHADDRSDRIASLDQLRKLTTLVNSFLVSHDGRFPKTLDELIATQKSPDPSLLIAPTATDKNKPSYELTLPAERITQVRNPAKTILIRSRYKFADGKTPVLFTDGHIEIHDPTP
jgi:hypothetical protein